MATRLLSDKYSADLHGVLNCYDRVIITGHVHPLCYPKGMTKYLYIHHIRIFDYTKLVEPLRDAIRANAQAIAKEHGLEIEFVRRSFRKEDRPWHDKGTGKTFIKSRQGKCLHYYFYFVDDDLGLCYLRVPTWCPFRLQFYFNGHNWLAHQLKRHGIASQQVDNAFLEIADFDLANQLAAQLDVEALHAKLDRLAQQYCPVVADLGLAYSWSIMQAEYATDLVFKHQQTLQAFYPYLLEALIQAVKPADVATFLGRKLHGNHQGELGNRFNVRWLGTRIKHQMGPVSIKLYDKFNFEGSATGRQSALSQVHPKSVACSNDCASMA